MNPDDIPPPRVPNSSSAMIVQASGVFAAPGINDKQREALIDFITKVVQSPGWKHELETRKWTDAFMTERPFERDLLKDIADKEVLMKELGLA